jgi:biopolymer transport protein TolR
MSMAAGGKRGAVKADINVTPLVDVVLVLLIIFMVVTPMLQRGKDVKLPIAAKQKHDKEGPDTDPMIVSITADRKVFLEKDPVDDQGLTQALATKLAAESWKPILVKGDQSLTFGDVRHVLKDAQSAKAKSVKLGVEEK